MNSALSQLCITNFRRIKTTCKQKSILVGRNSDLPWKDWLEDNSFKETWTREAHGPAPKSQLTWTTIKSLSTAGGSLWSALQRGPILWMTLEVATRVLCEHISSGTFLLLSLSRICSSTSLLSGHSPAPPKLVCHKGLVFPWWGTFEYICFRVFFCFQKIVFIHISKREYLRVVRRIWKKSCHTEPDVKMTFEKIEFYLCRIYDAFSIHVIFYFLILCVFSYWLDTFKCSQIQATKIFVKSVCSFQVILLHKKQCTSNCVTLTHHHLLAKTHFYNPLFGLDLCDYIWRQPSS